MREPVNREEERCRFFTKYTHQGYPLSLYRYKRAEDFFPDDSFFADTGGAGCTETFRLYLRNYIEGFIPERIRLKDSCMLELAENGEFIVTDGKGFRKSHLRASEEVLFHYLCFLHTAEFWQGFERIRDLNYKPKPLVIENFSGCIDGLAEAGVYMKKAEKLGRKVIIRGMDVLSSDIKTNTRIINNEERK